MAITKELFGKKLKDMTEEERKAYIRYIHKKEYKAHNDGFSKWCIEKFGKRHRDLSPEEKREFNRLRQQIRRQKLKSEE